MADPVKHVVSVLKNALDQIQNSQNISQETGNSSVYPQQTSASTEPQPRQTQSQIFVDAARRDFRCDIFIFLALKHSLSRYHGLQT